MELDTYSTTSNETGERISVSVSLTDSAHEDISESSLTSSGHNFATTNELDIAAGLAHEMNPPITVIERRYRKASRSNGLLNRSARPLSTGVMPHACERIYPQPLRPMSTSTVSAPASAMGSLAALNQYRCVVVGDGGVGKTSMLLRFVQGDFLDEYQPTHFDSFTVSMALGNELMPCTMTLVDTAGQETYDRLRTLTYCDADVFVVCFSVVDHDSFINVRHRWIPELRQFKPKTPIILVGTQTDLRDKYTKANQSSLSLGTANSSTCSSSSSNSAASTNTDQSHSSLFISLKEGKRLATKVKARGYSECSALTGDGLDQIFYQALMAAVVPKKKNWFWHRMKRLFAT